MSHTPGPWRLTDRGDEVQADRNFYIARLYGGFDDGGVQKEANARLIAAAPDLLAACNRLLELLNEDMDEELNDAWDAALAAIKKAEGRG